MAHLIQKLAQVEKNHGMQTQFSANTKDEKTRSVEQTKTDDRFGHE